MKQDDATEKMLLEELEVKSQNTDICDSDTDRSDTSDIEMLLNYDQEECDHMSPYETDSDGDNVTAADDSDTDNETERVMMQEVYKIGINYHLL
jgi:hypothetical protein